MDERTSWRLLVLSTFISVTPSLAAANSVRFCCPLCLFCCTCVIIAATVTTFLSMLHQHWATHALQRGISWQLHRMWQQQSHDQARSAEAALLLQQQIAPHQCCKDLVAYHAAAPPLCSPPAPAAATPPLAALERHHSPGLAAAPSTLHAPRPRPCRHCAAPHLLLPAARCCPLCWLPGCLC